MNAVGTLPMKSSVDHLVARWALHNKATFVLVRVISWIDFGVVRLKAIHELTRTKHEKDATQVDLLLVQ